MAAAPQCVDAFSRGCTSAICMPQPLNAKCSFSTRTEEYCHIKWKTEGAVNGGVAAAGEKTFPGRKNYCSKRRKWMEKKERRVKEERGGSGTPEAKVELSLKCKLIG